MSEEFSSARANGDVPPFWLARSRFVLSFLESGGTLQKHIFWIIVEILLVPFSWLISYLQWRDTQPTTDEKVKTPEEGKPAPPDHTQSNAWHIGAFLSAIAISALVGYLFDSAIPGPPWVRAMITAFLGTLALSLLTNIPTILLMHLMAATAIAERRDKLVLEIRHNHGQIISDLKAHDSATLDGFHDSYWRMDQILGHKVWAEERTYKFLSRIVQNEAREKAKWQMVNFLSRLADNHIFPEEDAGYFKITTESSGAWHISEYSDFLSDNIVHASKEIRWLVDPKDFVEYLIPYCISYLLGSIAAKKVGLPSESVWNEQHPVSCDYVFARIIKNACPNYCDEAATRAFLAGLNTRHHSERNTQDGYHAREHGTEHIEPAIFLKQGRSVGWWHDLHDIIFPSIAYFGNEIVKKEGVPDDKVILEGFSELYDNWIRKAFPHIDSFKRASAERAFRQLLLPEADTVCAAVDIIADKLSETIFEKTSGIRDLSIETRLQVVRLALRLFGELSGGTRRIDVCGFKGPNTGNEVSSYDVGLYDGKFLVRSIADGDYRLVEWYYLFQRPTKDDRLPRDIKFLTGILEHKTTETFSTLLRNTSSWKDEYCQAASEYDLLSDVLCERIEARWRATDVK